MQVAKIVKDGERTVLDLPDGAKMEFLSPSSEEPYCVMKGTLPPGVSVPLHSHADAESFYVLSGEAQALVQAEGGLERQTLKRGDFIHIAGGTKHAWQTIGESSTSLRCASAPR